MSAGPTTPLPRMIEVSPDGSVRELPPPTPAELAALRESFERDFDPVTMESRAIQRLRNEGNAHQEIVNLLRGLGPADAPPARVPMTERLRTLVTEETAQATYARAVDQRERKRRWEAERKKRHGA